MADKRMFSKTIIDSDTFLDMPQTTQLLYFHLGMYGDDEGFVNNPKKIQRSIGCADDDLKLLIAKGFVIPFDSGVIVIAHWYINNTLRKDRTKESMFENERDMLTIDSNGVYVLNKKNTDNQLPTICQPTDNQLPTICQPTDNNMVGKCPHKVREGKVREGKVREGKVREGKVREDEFSTNLSTFSHEYVNLTSEQYNALTQKYPKHIVDEYIRRVSDYCQSKGRNYSDYVMTISRWIDEDVAKGKVTLTKPSHDVDEWTRLMMTSDPSMFLDKK